MNRLAGSFICFVLLFIAFPSKVSASSISLFSSQDILTVDEEFLVDVQLSISSSDGTVYYLRGEFFQSAPSYCGYTWNGSKWYNGPYTTGDGWKNLLPISIQNNSWSGQLKTKIDISDSSCLMSGNYSFRIQRYTLTGSASSDTEVPISVFITVPTPSPTPSPTSTSTLTASPTSSQSPTPVSTPTKTPSPLPTETPNPKPLVAARASVGPKVSSSPSANILGIRNELSTSEPASPSLGKRGFPVIAIIFVVLGLGFVGTAGYLAYKKSKVDLPNPE